LTSYDVFWVFLSPLMFDKSVMVAVATGQGHFCSSDNNAVYCDARMFTTRNKKYTPPIFIITQTIARVRSRPHAFVCSGAGGQAADAQPLPMLLLVPQVACLRRLAIRIFMRSR
jgi:hypothetical protein